MRFRTKAATVLCLAVALIAGSSTAAQAAPSISGGSYSCGVGTMTTIASNGKGRINHQTGVTVWNSWNNGSTYQWRYSATQPSISDWRAFTTGVGGDVASAFVYCA